MLCNLRLKGLILQIRFTLVAVGGETLILAVDQHAAHERVRLEMLEDKYVDSSSDDILSARLCESIQLNVDPVYFENKEVISKVAAFGK